MATTISKNLIAGVYNGLQFKFGGNITFGTFRLYGINK